MNQIKDEKQKKMLLIIPLLAIPFITMLFWALGGGKNANAQSVANQIKGLNMELPGAKLKKDTTSNKLSFYEKAEQDSLKFKQERKDDPNYKSDSTSGVPQKDSLHRFDSGIAPKNEGMIGRSFSIHPLNSSGASLAASEDQINQKLAALRRQISQPTTAQAYNNTSGSNNSNAELSRVQAALQKMNTANAPDPEMQQLSGMLDKIQEIENPGITRQKQQEQSEKNRGEVFAVTGGRKDNSISTLDNGSQTPGFNNDQNGFYSMNNTDPIDSQNAIEAVVHETQTIVAGATVKLRLTNDVYINGTLIPKDNFVFGIASLNGERLTVKISSIRYHNSIFPVDLAVYDMDGENGIYIPGAITRDVAKESADQSVQNLDFTTYDPSIGAQAASAGVTAAKSLFSRKVRLVKVTVKAGYQVLLRDEKQKKNN